MYGAEVWTLNEIMKSKLLENEMDALWRSMRKCKFERIRNDFVRHNENALETA